MLHPRQFISTHTPSHLNTFLFLMTVLVLPIILDSFNALSCSSPGMLWAVAVVVVTVCGAVGGTLMGLVAGRGYTRFSLSPGKVYISTQFIHHTLAGVCLIDTRQFPAIP